MSFLNYLIPKGIKKIIKDIINKIDFLYCNMVNNNVLWCNESERLFLIKNFGDVTLLPDFTQKFTNLIRDMDGDSIYTLSKVISYQKKILNCNETKIDLFSDKEKKQLKKLNDDFYQEIIKLTDGFFVYKDFFLPINHFEASVFFYRHGIDSLKTIERIHDKTIIDVGGFIGDSVLIFSKLNPQKIISFEPVPENCSLMEKTISLNHLDNVIIERLALGCKDESLMINIKGSESSLYDISSSNYNSQLKIAVTSLDKYVDEHNISDISLIKVDIEGAEQQFLQGAKKTIFQQKPIILISIYHNVDDFFNIKPLIESWELGYSFSIHKPVFENATSEILLICEIL